MLRRIFTFAKPTPVVPLGVYHTTITNHARPIMASELRAESSDWATKVNIGNSHTIISDAKHKKRGVEVDLGITPKELLLTALSASSTMTIRSQFLLANKREQDLISQGKMSSFIEDGKHYENDSYLGEDQHWRHSALDSIQVHVKETHSENLFFPTKINLTFHFEGRLTKDQKTWLLSKAKMCPIRQIVSSTEPKVVITDSME